MRISNLIHFAIGLGMSSFTVASASSSVSPVTSPSDLNLNNVVLAVDAFGPKGQTTTVGGVGFIGDNASDYGSQVVVGSPYTTTASQNSFTYSNSVTAPSGGTDGNVSGPANAADTDPGLKSVIGSIIFGNQSVTLGGLTPGQSYEVQLLVSDVGNGARFEDVSVNGVLTDSAVPVATGVDYDIRENTVLPNSNGTITIDLTQAAGGDPNPVLSAIIVSTPEPASLAILALGGFLGLKRRRLF